MVGRSSSDSRHVALAASAISQSADGRRQPVTGHSRPQSAIADDLALHIGGCTFVITSAPLGWMDGMPPRILACQLPNPTASCIEISVEISDENFLLPPSAPHDLNDTARVNFKRDVVHFTFDWCEGFVQLYPTIAASVRVHSSAGQWFPAIIENTLRLILAYRALDQGGVLLHSACIFREEQAAVLFGHSGAGKSTASEVALAGGCAVLSDDINLLRPTTGSWHVHPVPFGGISSPTRGEVALRGLYRLHQATRDAVQTCSSARSVALLSGSAPFVNRDPYRSEQLVDILTALANAVPVHDLCFTRSTKFLEHVLSGVKIDS